MRGLFFPLGMMGGLIGVVTLLGYFALTTGGPTAVPISLEGVAEHRQPASAPMASLSYAMNVVQARGRTAAAPASAPENLSEDARRQKVINRLETRDGVTETEREQLIAQLWGDVGKSQDINQEIFRATLAAMNPMMSSEASPDSLPLRNLVNRSVGLMVAANPDPNAAALEVAGFLERVPNAPVRKMLVDAFSGSYYDGKNVIRRELAGRAIPVTEDEADSVTNR